MLKYKSEINELTVKIDSRSIDIIFYSQGGSVGLSMPSAEELYKLRKDYQYKLSIPEISDSDIFNLKSRFKDEFNRLVEKYENKSISKSYLHNLSGLAEKFDDLETSNIYINRAIELDDTDYSLIELGENYLHRGLKEKSFELYKSMDSNNIHTLLRLAYFSITDNDLGTSEEYVHKALKVDSLNYDVRLFHGAICLIKNEYELAVRSFKLASAKKPNSSVALVNLAAAYWKLGLTKKAYKYLKRSLILNPFNENAVSFFADASNILGLDIESLPVIKNYLNFEQKNDHLWGQYARASFAIGKKLGRKSYFNNAIEALKHQESLNSSYIVWNNLALCAWYIGDKDKSERYFNYSIKKAISNNQSIALPLYNLAGTMIKESKFTNLVPLFESLLTYLNNTEVDSDIVEKIKLQHVVLKESVGDRLEAKNLAEEYLNSGLHLPKVQIDLLNKVLYFYIVYQPNYEVVQEYEKRINELLSQKLGLDSISVARAYNNIAFAHMEFGQLGRAEKYINLMSNSFHIDPFTTATLGKYKISKGEIEDGKRLYRESISFLKELKYKRRFNQRLNFELGKYFLSNGDLKKSKRYLDKAKNEKHGSDYMVSKIKKLKNQLLIQFKK